MSAVFIDHTTRNHIASGNISDWQAALRWAKDHFRILEEPSDFSPRAVGPVPEFAQIDSILVSRRDDGGWDIEITAQYEGCEQRYTGIVWGSA